MAIAYDPRTVLSINTKPTRTQWKQIILFVNNRVLYETLFVCHREFLTKSEGDVDSYGEKWKPLADSTRIYKALRPGEYRQYGMHRWTGNRAKGKGGMSKKELLANREVPINIDTGRLIKAVKPYKFINGKYIDSPDQSSRVTENDIHFHINVPYGDAVNEVRPFFPVFENPWVAEALQRSVPYIQRYLKTLKLA